MSAEKRAPARLYMKREGNSRDAKKIFASWRGRAVRRGGKGHVRHMRGFGEAVWGE
jgi:hypothetical protein